MNLLEFSWLNLIVCRFWCIVLGLYVWKGLRFNSYLFAGMMSLGKIFIMNVLNQLNACKICLELWTFIIYMTCIGGNFSALYQKCKSWSNYILMHDSERIPYLWQVEVWLYVWSQVVAVQTECFEHFRIIALLWMLVICMFFSFLFCCTSCE